MTEPHGTDDDPRLAPLLQWRDGLIESGVVSARTFKEAHVRLVLRSGFTDVERIRAMLPGTASEHAEQMAELLATLAVPAATPPPETLGRHRSADDAPAGDVPGPLGITVRVRPGGGVELAWPDAETAAVRYRVVSAEDEPPRDPAGGEQLTETFATSADDERPVTSAVRHYEVWIVGDTAHPVLHATGVQVGPVLDAHIQEDAGRVIGQWSVWPGTESVHVHRIPRDDDAEPDDERHRILRDSDNRSGFIDTQAERGRNYTYQVRSAVTVAGVVRLSSPVSVDVDVSAVLVPVTDLAVARQSTDGTVFDLSWSTPPAGRVVICRTETGPSPGVDLTELPESALGQVGLPDISRLTQPVADDPETPGQSMMSAVSWPSQWNRAYFTPLTLIGERVVVGRTFSTVRTGVIRDIEVTEYCNKQVLTFDWPDGAAAVLVHLTPRGHDPTTGLLGQPFEITAEEYERYGGVHFTGQLPVGGCSLHLSPVAFSGGRRVLGAMASVDYAGLLRLQYAVRVGRDASGEPFTATIAMRAEQDVPGSPPFVLVNNTQRVPLSLYDGDPVDVAPLDERGRLAAQPTKELRWSQLSTAGGGELWAANVRGRRGWIRLFVNTATASNLRVVALLDPPVDTLRLTVGAP
jgi:hypothetical protein